MWPDLIRKAKEGGLNMIETYVFWNAHEPEYGKVKLVQLGEILHYLTQLLIQLIYLLWNSSISRGETTW